MCIRDRIQLVEFDIQNTADSNGVFTISGILPNSVIVQLTAKGYETKVVKLICCDQITLTLEPDLHDLNEVLITAQSKELNGSKTQKTDYLSLKKMGILGPLNLMASLEQLEGVQLASYGPLNAKPVIRGMQGMRVVTFLNGMRVENQQWGADHGLGPTSSSGTAPVGGVSGSSVGQTAAAAPAAAERPRASRVLDVSDELLADRLASGVPRGKPAPRQAAAGLAAVRP